MAFKGFGALGVPKKIDPLQTILKSNQTSRGILASLGISDPTAKPSPSALERLFGILDIPGVAVRGVAHNIVDPIKPVNIGAEVGKSFRGERRIEGADILSDVGVKNKWGKMLGGLAVDILLDPLTYVTAGIGGAGKASTTSTFSALVRGEETLDNVLDASKLLKYGDHIDEVGHLKDAVSLPKEIAASLYDDVAEALGYKSGIKFMGAKVIPAKTGEMGRGFKALLRGQNEKVPTAVNDILRPASELLERGFIHDELTPIYREGNEAIKAFVTTATRRRNAGIHVADKAAEALERQFKTLIPDERVRMLVSKGIGEQMGDTTSITAMAKAFDKKAKVSKALEKAAQAGKPTDLLEDNLATAVHEISRMRYDFFDPAAVRRVLAEGGVPAADLDNVVDATASIQKHFEGILGAKREVGLEAKSRFGPGPGGESVGYTPGTDLWRPSAKEMRTTEGLATDVFGQADVVAPEHTQNIFSRLTRPSAETSKEYPNIAFRRAGQTTEDLAKGSAGGQGIRSEADIAVLLGRKAKQGYRDVAYKRYVDDITSVLGENEDLIATLEKSREFFTNDKATQGFLKAGDRGLNAWRKWATIYNFPMFPARNWISNKFLLSTEGIMDPTTISKAIQIAAKPQDAAKLTFKFGGRTMNGAEWLDEAKKLRVYVGEPETLQLVGGSLKGKSVIKKTEAFFGDVNQRLVEDSDRMAGYFAALNKGMDPEAAAILVDKALYNYAPEALTVFERNVARRLTPFYTFMRHNTPHMAELLVTKPGSLTWVGHAKESGEAATGIDAAMLPEYTKNLFSIPLPTDEENPLLLSTSGILPLGDLERILPLQDPMEFGREQLSSVNPFIRDLFIEFPTNTDIYRAGPIESHKGEKRKVPDYIDAFDEAVDDIPVVDDAWDKVKSTLGIEDRTNASGDTYLAMNAYAAKAIKDFVPWMNSISRFVSKDEAALISQLTGLKSIPYEEEEFTRSKAYDERQTLSDEIARLRDMGLGGKKKPSAFKPKGDPPDALAVLTGQQSAPKIDPWSLPQQWPMPSAGGYGMNLPSPEELAAQLLGARQSLNLQEKQQAMYDAAQKKFDAAQAKKQNLAISSTQAPMKGTTGLASQRGKAKYGLQPYFWNRLNRANKAMKAAGLGSFGITDGFRPLGKPSDSENAGTQWAVWKRYKAGHGALAARPGTSRHGLGLAADLDLNSKQQRWLERNGRKYGVYRIASESWHWQPT